MNEYMNEYMNVGRGGGGIVYCITVYYSVDVDVDTNAKMKI